jgi:hypothetical protein
MLKVLTAKIICDTFSYRIIILDKADSLVMGKRKAADPELGFRLSSTEVSKGGRVAERIILGIQVFFLVSHERLIFSKLSL